METKTGNFLLPKTSSLVVLVNLVNDVLSSLVETLKVKDPVSVFGTGLIKELQKVQVFVKEMVYSSFEFGLS